MTSPLLWYELLGKHGRIIIVEFIIVELREDFRPFSLSRYQSFEALL